MSRDFRQVPTRVIRFCDHCRIAVVLQPGEVEGFEAEHKHEGGEDE